MNVRPSPKWHETTVLSFLDKWAHARADVNFLTDAQGQALTFADCLDRVDRLSRLFMSQGLNAGDAVLLRAGRRPEGFLALLAAMHAGLDVCVVPEGLSARQATEGAVAFAPKMAIDAGLLGDVPPESLRIMDIAANLFTIRLVGCFGTAPDGLVDFDTLTVPATQDKETASSSKTTSHTCVHMLHASTDGRVVRYTRDQKQLLSQALASALVSGLSPTSSLGTAYEPISLPGLLGAALPALLVGCGFWLFDPVAPALGSQIKAWTNHDPTRHTILPLSAADHLQPGEETTNRQHTWIGSTSPAPEPLRKDRFLLDCNGAALLPALLDEDGHLTMPPGLIVASGEQGDEHGAPPTIRASKAVSFGTLRLEAHVHTNEEARSLLNGEICLASPLAASIHGRTRELLPTGQLAKLEEHAGGQHRCKPVPAENETVKVGNTRVSLSAVNRALGLTGRWQDAAVFAVADPVLSNRIEVAVEPRLGDGMHATLPTLSMVRSMLRDCGVSDAGLPIRLHLVKRVPRRGRGVLDVEALPDYRWNEVITLTIDDETVAA